MNKLQDESTARLDSLEANTAARLDALSELMQRILLATGAANQGPLGVVEGSQQQAPQRQQSAPWDRPLTKVLTSEEKSHERGGLDVSVPIVPAGLHPKSEDVESENDSMDWSTNSASQISTEERRHDAAIDKAIANNLWNVDHAAAKTPASDTSMHESTEIVISERPVLAGVRMEAAQRREALRAAVDAVLSEDRIGVMVMGHSA